MIKLRGQLSGSRFMSRSKKPVSEKATIILHSNDYDRVTNALSLASICLSMGMETHILLTYCALKRFVKGHLEDDCDTAPDILGVIKKSIDSGINHSIEEKLATARNLGLKLYACTNAMVTLGLTPEDLVEEVDEVMGLTAFIQLSKGAAINWYI
jgi:peroxiredoxin family protein